LKEKDIKVIKYTKVDKQMVKFVNERFKQIKSMENDNDK